MVLTEKEEMPIIRYMSNYQKENVERFAEIFKALSNPNRLRIFLTLVSCCEPGIVHTIEAEAGKAYVGELAKDLAIGSSTVSHHIKELHRAGLIHMERKGQNVECWIDADVVRDLATFFSQ
jgi:ArsR family transcriptional regulator